MGIGFRIHPRTGGRDPALIEALRGIPTPILSDNMSRIFAGGPGLRPMHKGAPMIGFALTIRTRPGDNLMVHKAIDVAEPGEVIVVDAGGDLTNAIIGEIMATLAKKRGVAGFVIDGAIRDSDAIAAADFPIFARGVTHRGPYKDGPGEIGIAISVGGHVIAPGDIVVGDADGVLAVPAAEAMEIAALGRAQLDREAAILSSIEDGTVDRRWVDETLRAKGVL
jgi:regulator of RNase E activity RraA